MRAVSIGVLLRRGVVVLVLASVVWYMTAGCGKDECASGTDSSSPPGATELGRLISARPVPDLGRLAQRCSPNYRGHDATESFYDILKLREVGDANAVGVLEKILAENSGSTRIHGYAAGQALFCIGTSEAHKVLAKYLLTSRYNTSLGIRYTSHWEMNQPRRKGFIERYHLKNLAKDLELRLSVARPNGADDNIETGPQFDFTLTLSNSSDKAFWIMDRQVYQSGMLYFQSEDGGFIIGQEKVRYNMPMPRWLELGPGASHKYVVRVYIRFVGELERRPAGLREGTSIVADTKDIMFDIGKGGRFKVYALFEQAPLAPAHREQLGFETGWSGQAVSDPVTVEIFRQK